jgi:hypothetical protein
MKKLLPFLLVFLIYLPKANAVLVCDAGDSVIQSCGEWFATTSYGDDPDASVTATTTSRGTILCEVSKNGSVRLRAGYGSCQCQTEDGALMPFDESHPACQGDPEGDDDNNNNDDSSGCSNTETVFKYEFKIPNNQTTYGGNPGGYGHNSHPSSLCPEMGGCQMEFTKNGYSGGVGSEDLTLNGDYKQTGGTCETPSAIMEYATDEPVQALVVNPDNPLEATLETDDIKFDSSKTGNEIVVDGTPYAVPLAESNREGSKGKDLQVVPQGVTEFTTQSGQAIITDDYEIIANIYLQSEGPNDQPTFSIINASASGFPAVQNDFDNPSNQSTPSVFPTGDTTTPDTVDNTTGDGLDGTSDGEGMEGFATSDNQQTQIGLLQQIANGLNNGDEQGEEDPNNATGGQDCTQAPVCTLGESVECAQLMQLWLQRCEAVNPELAAKVDEYYQHGLGIEGNENGIVQSLDFGDAIGDILNTEITNACPPSKTFDLLNQTYVLPSQPFCDAAQSIRPIVLVVGIYLVALIVGRGNY